MAVAATVAAQSTWYVAFVMPCSRRIRETFKIC